MPKTDTNTRERLIDATERIIREQGIMAVTTKDIASAAGVAEGTLYNHFQDKVALLLAVMAERISGNFLQIIRELPERAGEGTVEGTIEELVAAALAFFTHTMPLNVALAADPQLNARHTQRLRELGTGPDVALRSVMEYIEAEQRLGRIRPDISPAAAGTILLGVCFNYAQARCLRGAAANVLTEDRFAPEIAQTLLHGLAPAPGERSASN